MNSVKKSSLQFFIIQFIVILFWGVPEVIQKIPKVFFLCFLVCLYFVFLKEKYISLKQFFRNLIIVFGCLIISYKGAYQSSLINMLFSSFAIGLLPYVWRVFTPKEEKIARRICYLVCFSMFLQLLFFRTDDGRPTLGYEINWSAAYLFLFFIYSDLIKFKFGKIFVLISSLLLLSRLLILAIALFFFVKLLKKKIIPQFKLNWIFILSLSYGVFLFFNSWFLQEVEIDVVYDTSINRVSSLNDRSNKLRFTVNMLILEGLLNGDPNLKFGYGQISKGANEEYQSNYILMPHNELLDSIAEFGWIFTLYLLVFSSFYLNKLFRFENYEYIFPIIVYTLILWTRFLIVPSLELFFLFFMLGYNLKKHEVNFVIS